MSNYSTLPTLIVADGPHREMTTATATATDEFSIASIEIPTMSVGTGYDGTQTGALETQPSPYVIK